MQNEFLKLVTLLVKKCFKLLNVSQKKNLADLMTTFLSSTSFASWNIDSLRADLHKNLEGSERKCCQMPFRFQPT